MRIVGFALPVLALAALAAGGGCSGARNPETVPPLIIDANAVDAGVGNMVGDPGDVGDMPGDDGAENASADWNDMEGPVIVGSGYVPGGPEAADGEAAVGAAPRVGAGAGSGAGGGDEEWCDLLDAYASARHCQALRRQRGGLQRRTIDLEAPAEMFRDEAADVLALLRRPGAAPRQSDGRVVRGRTDVMAATVMIARLSGDGFDVEPAGWVEMQAGPDRVGRWEWRVTPRGDQERRTLRVVARPRLTGSGGPAADLEEYEDSVTVTVRVRPSVRSQETAQAVKEQSEGWAKALGGLAALVAALGALYAAIRKLVRPGRKGEAAAPAAGDA